MLPVSDLLEVAMNQLSTAEASARAPQRFTRTRIHGPVIIWNVCVHCNMTCPHCYASAGSRPSAKDLTTAEACNLLDQMAACGVTIVIFSGGEPLLRPDLFELLAHARSRGIAAQLSSNGTLIDEETARRLAEVGVPYVGISVDGVREFNDPYRGMEGGTEAALAGLRFAKAAGMRTGLRMTLTARNIDQLDAVLDSAREVGASRFYASHLVYSGRGRQLVDEDLPRERARSAVIQLFEAAEKLLERGHSLRIVTGSNDSDGPLLLRWARDRYGAAAAAPVEEMLRERGGNSAGERILNVDHLGQVHPDQFWRDAVLGDVRRERFETILAHPLRQQLRDRAEHLTGRCGQCAYLALCRGSHRERAVTCHGDIWAPDPACLLTDAEIGLDPANPCPDKELE